MKMHTQTPEAPPAPENLCLNHGMEEAGVDGGPANWHCEDGSGTWTRDEAHSGEHSLQVTSAGSGTVGWRSASLAVPQPGGRFRLRVWAKLQDVGGGHGATMTLHTFDADGREIGHAGILDLGGAGQQRVRAEWTEHTFISHVIGPDVRSVGVGLALDGAAGRAWFDDVTVTAYPHHYLSRARRLRRGITLDRAAIVCGAELQRAAERLQSCLRAIRGVSLPVVLDEALDLTHERRDLIVLGNLTNNRVAEYLYRHSYTCEDGNFPGRGGYVLRPLVDPLGTGRNFLVVGSFDDEGVERGIEKLVGLATENGSKPWEGEAPAEPRAVDLDATPARQEPRPPTAHPHSGTGASLVVPLIVETGPGYGGLKRFPWLARGPVREMRYVATYMKSGDLEPLRKLREEILRTWFIPDEQLFHHTRYAGVPVTPLHLNYAPLVQAWDLISDSEVFSDEERLRLTNRLLDMLRSTQGYGLGLFLWGRMSQGNHATRAGLGFYYGWRHFHKYYREELGPELEQWRRRLEEFWHWPLRSARSLEDSLSQHALGGSMVNALTIALMEPEWSREFFTRHARPMADRCVAICNNMGQTVLLGDVRDFDYPASIFAILAYYFQDARYTYLLQMRGDEVVATDEHLRGFAIGLEPRVPEHHVGLHIVPPDRLYYDTTLPRKAGVPFGKSFDKLTFRGGFDVRDEYLLLDGVGGHGHSYDDANTIGEYSANGRRWLCEIDMFNGPTLNFHNAVTVARDGLGISGVPQCAELVRSANGDGWAYTATRLPQYNGVAWTRHLFWLTGRYFLALDEMVAEEPADYAFVCRWRGLGEATLAPGRYTAAQDEPPPGDPRLQPEAEPETEEPVEGAVGTRGLVIPAGSPENRFTLCFPPELAATLDHDTEALGKYLPASPYYQPVLNIIEQPQNCRLASGERTTFQNLFYASTGDDPKQFAIRRLNPHAVLVHSGTEVALLGAAVDLAEATLGELCVSGPCFYVSPERCILPEGAVLLLNGRHIATVADGDAATVRAALTTAWEQLGAPATAAPSAAVATPVMRAKAAGDLPGMPLALLPVAGTIVVGGADGVVRRLDAAAQPTGEFRTGGPVHALCPVDLDGDGQPEILAGSDDEHLYALDTTLALRWQRRISFLAKEQPWLWWTLRSAKVRAIHAADIDGDGRPEIFLGVGNMRAHCLDATGEERWRFRTDHGTPATLATADVFGDGKTRLLVGNDICSSNGACWVLDEEGKLLQRYANGSWCTTLPTVAVADLDGDGTPTVFCGNNRGDLRAWAPRPAGDAPLWERNLAGPIRALTVLPRPGTAGSLIAAGSESGYVVAFDQRGEKVWAVPLSSAVLKTALLPAAGDRPTGVVAGCKDGGIFAVAPDGELLARFDCHARLRDLACADIDGDGVPEILVATSAPDRVFVLGLPSPG